MTYLSFAPLVSLDTDFHGFDSVFVGVDVVAFDADDIEPAAAAFLASWRTE